MLAVEKYLSFDEIKEMVIEYHKGLPNDLIVEVVKFVADLFSGELVKYIDLLDFIIFNLGVEPLDRFIKNNKIDNETTQEIIDSIALHYIISGDYIIYQMY